MNEIRSGGCKPESITIGEMKVRFRGSIPRYRLRMFFGFVALFASVGTLAQTVDEIVAKHIAVQGGAARLRSIQSTRAVGRVEVVTPDQPTVGRIAILHKRPNSLRRDIVFGSFALTEAYDGKTGWRVISTGEQKGPELLTGDDLSAIQEEAADFAEEFLDYKQKGITVELLGREAVDGIETHHLRVTLPSGEIRDSFFNAQTFLTVKAISKKVRNGKVQESESLVGDYREVSGMMTPFSMDIHVLRSTSPVIKVRLEKVEFNGSVDDGEFKPPYANPAKTDK